VKGIGVPDLHLDQIQNLVIPLPSMEDQRRFAERIQAIEEIKTALKQSLAETEALFAALQYRAFRGEL